MKKALSRIYGIVLLLGCSMEDITPRISQDFYPIEIGQKRVYEVYRIDYELIGFDTTNYFLQEIVTDSIVSSNGETTFLVQSSSSLDGGIWEIEEVYTIRKSERDLVLTASNYSEVKLVFPVDLFTEWDKNAYNTETQHMVKYEDDVSFVSSDELMLSENLIKVNIYDHERNIVNQNQQFEIYGENIGLLQKTSTVLEFCTTDCDSTGQIDAGYFLSQTLISYE